MQISQLLWETEWSKKFNLAYIEISYIVGDFIVYFHVVGKNPAL